MENTHTPCGLYERFFKRPLDVVCAIAAIIVFCWLYALIAILVRVKLGRPVIFKQPRPGIIDPETGHEKIFMLRKFRTMTDERDENGCLLPDDVRLTKFGKMLRATSLDELPEAICILKGEMSVVGPRPQLAKDMVFMSKEQRMRHTVKPGLSGLAQVMGRNAITWEEKLNWDLKYIENVTFRNDLWIVLLTVKQVFARKHITESSKETDLSLDYGDALLKRGEVSLEKYKLLQAHAKDLINSR